MIPAVDAALRRLIVDHALSDGGVEVAFDAPTKDWSARRNAPTVNLYLYDIREDMNRRARGLLNVYDDHGVIVARRMPPRYFNLSYLLTAWTQRAEDEHRLLADILTCLLEHDVLSGVDGVPLPHVVTVALPPPRDRSFADVWSALGGELKPSLDVVVGVPFDRAPTHQAGPPVSEPMVIGMTDTVNGGVERGLRGRGADTPSRSGRSSGGGSGGGMRRATAPAGQPSPGAGG